MYVCTYVRTYVRMYVCMYVCVRFITTLATFFAPGKELRDDQKKLVKNDTVIDL